MYKKQIRIFIRKERTYNLKKSPRFWELTTLLAYSSWTKQKYFKDE